MHVLLLFAVCFALVSCDDKNDMRPPTVLAATLFRSGEDQVQLCWTLIPFAGEYRIYSSEQSDGAFELVALSQDTMWRDFVGNPDSLETRFYEVTAIVDSVESLPSEQVGFVLLRVAQVSYGSFGSWPFCVSLTPWSADSQGVPILGTVSYSPKDIFGSQAASFDGISGDKIMDQTDTSLVAWRTPSGDWAGSLMNVPMSSAWPYWLRHYSGPDASFLLCGRVENGANESVFVEGAPVEGVTQNTSLCFKDARVVSVDRLGLLEAGFIGGTVISSDVLVGQDPLAEVRYYPSSGWVGALTHVSPGNAYWIQRKHLGGFDYTYTPQ